MLMKMISLFLFLSLLNFNLALGQGKKIYIDINSLGKVQVRLHEQGGFSGYSQEHYSPGVYSGSTVEGMFNSVKGMTRSILNDLTQTSASLHELDAAKKRYETVKCFVDEYLSYLYRHNEQIRRDAELYSDFYQRTLREFEEFREETRKRIEEMRESHAQTTAKLLADIEASNERLEESIRKRREKVRKEEEEDDFLNFLSSRKEEGQEDCKDKNGFYLGTVITYQDLTGDKTPITFLTPKNSEQGEELRDNFVLTACIAKNGRPEEAKTHLEQLRIIDLLYSKNNQENHWVKRYSRRVDALAAYFDECPYERQRHQKQRQSDESKSVFGDHYDSQTYAGHQLVILSNALAKTEQMNSSDEFYFLAHLSFGQAVNESKRLNDLVRPTQEDYRQFHEALDVAWSLVDFGKGLTKGIGNTVIDLVVGTYELIRHPIKSVEALSYAILHYDQTYDLIKEVTLREIDSFDSYSAEEKGELVGRVAGEIASLLVPQAQIAKVAKLPEAMAIAAEHAIHVQSALGKTAPAKKVKKVVTSARKLLVNKSDEYTSKFLKSFGNFMKNTSGEINPSAIGDIMESAYRKGFGKKAKYGDFTPFKPSTLDPRKMPKQMEQRGWTKSSVGETINKPNKTYKTRDVRHKPDGSGRMDDPATGYVNSDGSYVVRNDRTGDIVQISDRKNPNDWFYPDWHPKGKN